MKIFRSVRRLSNGSEIGYITAGLDKVYLAIHTNSSDPELGLIIPADRLEIIEAIRPEDPEHTDSFIAMKWTKELGRRIEEIEDLLTDLLYSHPRLYQIELFIDPDFGKELAR